MLGAGETLKPGENVYAYVTGSREGGDPATPLVADGTNRDGEGHCVRDPLALGGVWAGKKAVVIRLDNSGGMESLRSDGMVSYVPSSPGRAENLLGKQELGPDLRLLDPAVTARPQPAAGRK